MQQETFDPYRKWLGIAPKDQPPNLYRLLGIDLFESDTDVIANATDQRMNHVRTFQTGPHSALSQRILNELSSAKLRLLDPTKRADYDRELKAQLNGGTAAAEASASGVNSSGQNGAETANGSASATAAAASTSSSIIRRQEGLKPDRPRSAPPPLKPTRAGAAPVAAEAATNGTAKSSDESGITALLGDRASEARSGQRRTPTPTVKPGRPGAAKRKSLWPVISLAAGGVIALAILAWGIFGGGRGSDDAKQLATTTPANTPSNTTPVPVVPPKAVDPPVKVNPPVKVETPPPVAAKAPKIEDLPDQVVDQDGALSVRVMTSGASLGSTYRFKLENPPAGATIDPESGEIRWEVGSDVAAGTYPLKIALVRRDANETVGRSQVSVQVRPGLGVTDGRGLKAELYSDGAFIRLHKVRADRRIDGVWIDSVPQEGLPADQYSIRWTGWIKAPKSGNYTLYLVGSGGSARLWLDDKVLLTSPHGQPRWKIQGPAEMDAEPHKLRVEYRHNEGPAVLGLQWLRPDGIEEIVPVAALFHKLDVAQAAAQDATAASTIGINAGLQADIFRDDKLSEKLTSLTNRSLNWAWGVRKSLRGQIKGVRWTGMLKPPAAGDYRLAVVHDGQFRLWIGDTLVIDAWTSKGLVRNTADVKLAESQPLKIEYVYEGEGSTALSIRWQRSGTTDEELIPATAISIEPPAALKREAVPSAEVVTKAVDDVKKEFAADYKAVGAEGRTALVEKLRVAATNRAIDPARRYALLSEARDISARQPNLDAAWKAIDLMQRYFNVDAVAIRSQALQMAADSARNDAEATRAVAESYLALLQMALETGHYLQGVDSITPALAAAAHLKDREMRIGVNNLGKQLKELAPEEARAVAARKTLAETPTDAAANFAAGRFTSLFQRDWEAGLPLLAKGSNEVYRAAAAADLLQPTDAASKKKIGDLWWAAQKLESDPAKQRVRQRAQFWYEQARAGVLSPKDSAEVASRLQEIQRDAAVASTPDLRGEAPPREPASTPSRPKLKPLDAGATQTLAKHIINSNGRVRTDTSGYEWLYEGGDYPEGQFTILGVKLENDAADDTVLRAIGRLPALDELYLDSKTITDNGVRGLQDLSKLKRLEMAQNHATDNGLSAVGKLSALEALGLRGNLIGGSMAWLKQLPKLRALGVNGEKVNEATLITLGQLTQLEELSINNGKYPSSAVEKLAGLTKLRKLYLRGNSVSDAVLTKLPELKSLKELIIEGAISRTGLAALSKYNLETLNITSPLIGDAELAPLSELKTLTRLELRTRPIGDAGLGKLAALTSLKTLDVHSASGVTDAGVALLKPLKNVMSVNLEGAKISRDAYRRFRSDHPEADLRPRPEYEGWHRNGSGRNSR